MPVRKVSARLTEQDVLPGMKVCNTCGVSKPVGLFSADRRKRDGLRSSCKECCKSSMEKWRKANHEKELEYGAAYRAANREQCRSSCAEWRAANRDKSRAYNLIWAMSNRDKRLTHHANRRARKRAAGGTLSPDLTAKLINLQKGKCACCGRPLGNDFHLDHIMPLALGGTNTDDNIQLLTATCNHQKHAKHPVDFMQQRGFLL